MFRLRPGLVAMIALAALFLCLTTGPTVAQKDSPPVKGYLPANWKKIGLADDQVKTIYKIQAGYDTKIDALKAQINDLKKDERSELEKVLTAAQKERLKEILIGTIDKDAPKDKDKTPPKDNPK